MPLPLGGVAEPDGPLFLSPSFSRELDLPALPAKFFCSICWGEGEKETTRENPHIALSIKGGAGWIFFGSEAHKNKKGPS